MYRLYRDIRDKMGEPLWHDEHGVPRYEPYHPSMGGIYDRWAALLEIQCQGCDRTFLVGIGYPPGQSLIWGYGDAPWHVYYPEGGQCMGTTMSTDVRRIVEFWTKDDGKHATEWRRRPEHERAA